MKSVYIGYDIIGYPMFMFHLSENFSWNKIFCSIKSSFLNDNIKDLVFNEHDFVPSDKDIKELETLGFKITIIESSINLRKSEYSYLFDKEDTKWQFI